MLTLVWRRFGRLTTKWPKSLRERFRLYNDKTDHPILKGFGAAEDDAAAPVWVWVPGWLHRKMSADSKCPDEPRFLPDILLAQLCLFAHIRIHDDLFDGTALDRALPLVAHQFRVEAERLLVVHLSGAAGFWPDYLAAMERTAWSAFRVSELEKQRTCDPRSLMRGYADEAAALQVAGLAICHRYTTLNAMKEVRALSAAMTIAGQVLDDLRDLGEDLAQGKINLAANLMIRAAERAGIPVELTVDSLVDSAARSGGFLDILNLVARQLARAKSAARRLELPEAVALIERYQGWPKAMKEEIHRRRIDALFQSLQRVTGNHSQVRRLED